MLVRELLEVHDPSADLDEGWREKTAATLAAATLGYGAYDSLNKIPQTPTEPATVVAPQSKTFSKEQNKNFLIKRVIAQGIQGYELKHFMTQAAHETADFSKLRERGTAQDFHLKYSPSANPKVAKEIGNITDQDAVTYCGRGFLHITGRYNYKVFGPKGGHPDVFENPTLLETDPIIAADVSIAYWKSRVRPRIKDFKTATVQQITQIINPGEKSHNLAQRQVRFAKMEIK